MSKQMTTARRSRNGHNDREHNWTHQPEDNGTRASSRLQFGSLIAGVSKSGGACTRSHPPAAGSKTQKKLAQLEARPEIRGHLGKKTCALSGTLGQTNAQVMQNWMRHSGWPWQLVVVASKPTGREITLAMRNFGV